MRRSTRTSPSATRRRGRTRTASARSATRCPEPSIDDPSVRVISTEELQALVGCLGTSLSGLESEALRLYLDGHSYESMGDELGCDCKTIDNALQRVKRKILAHQAARAVPA